MDDEILKSNWKFRKQQKFITDFVNPKRKNCSCGRDLITQKEKIRNNCKKCDNEIQRVRKYKNEN